MRKIIELAVIVAGIDEEYQNSLLDGITKCAKMNHANISCFCAFGGVLSSSRYDQGEYNIYSLVNYKKFDGVILMTNTISDPVEKEKILTKVRDSGLPVTVLDCSEYPEFYNVSIDNYQAMKDIVEHVIKVHGAKLINYISGPLANPEASDRYRAFLEVMSENSLVIDMDRVFFGEFRPSDGKKAVEKFIRSGMSRPEAIICANDAMALAAIEELSNFGYVVPDDIIVTGFDNTYNARHHLPALTTVSRPLDEAGFTACEILIDVISGKEHDKTTTLESSPVFTGSCGCSSSGTDDMAEYMVSIYKALNSCKRDISIINRMTTELAENETSASNMRTIAQFINDIQFDRFAVCLCTNWDKVIKGNSHNSVPEKIQVNSYTEKMTAPIVIEGGINSPVKLFSTADMHPRPLTGGGNVSYFLPLHFRERCLGYYIFTNSSFPTKSLLCHTLILNISNSVENIRKLLHLNSMIDELDRLYVIDPLCNIYNRNGFIRTADVMFRHCQEKGSKLLIAFIDMDGLKMINDNYGHKEGDFALQRLAGVIKDCSGSGRICARFGGDEFIILGSDASEDDASAIETAFYAQMENINSIIKKPYSIDASIGTIVTEVEGDKTLFNLITQADEIMYAKKKRKKTSRYLRRD